MVAAENVLNVTNTTLNCILKKKRVFGVNRLTLQVLSKYVRDDILKLILLLFREK